MTYYIQRKDRRDLETADEFETYKEARAIGLTWRDGVTMNGKPEQFFIGDTLC